MKVLHFLLVVIIGVVHPKGAAADKLILSPQILVLSGSTTV